MKTVIKGLCAALLYLAAFQAQADESCATDKQGNPPRNLFAELSVDPDKTRQEENNQGFMVLCYDIDEAGKVQNIRVMEAQPERMFDKAVFIAMSKWRYPTNEPIKDHRITLRFKHDDKAKVTPSTVPFR
jgi:protein TonB